MKSIRFFIILVVAIILLGCEKESNKNLIYNLDKPNIFTADDYEIYNLIFNPYNPKQEEVFIDQKTAYVQIDTNELSKNVGVRNLLIQNYYSQKDDNKYLNENSFFKENNVILIPDDNDDRYIFNEIYNSPKGRFLSNIGYNEDYSEALVGAIDRIDCGMIYYTYYLRKENNEWSINWNNIYGIICN